MNETQDQSCNLVTLIIILITSWQSHTKFPKLSCKSLSSCFRFLGSLYCKQTPLCLSNHCVSGFSQCYRVSQALCVEERLPGLAGWESKISRFHWLGLLWWHQGEAHYSWNVRQSLTSNSTTDTHDTGQLPSLLLYNDTSPTGVSTANLLTTTRTDFAPEDTWRTPATCRTANTSCGQQAMAILGSWRPILSPTEDVGLQSQRILH